MKHLLALLAVAVLTIGVVGSASAGPPAMAQDYGVVTTTGGVTQVNDVATAPSDQGAFDKATAWVNRTEAEGAAAMRATAAGTDNTGGVAVNHVGLREVTTGGIWEGNLAFHHTVTAGNQGGANDMGAPDLANVTAWPAQTGSLGTNAIDSPFNTAASTASAVYGAPVESGCGVWPA